MDYEYSFTDHAHVHVPPVATIL